MHAAKLTCEYAVDPIGLDTPAPRLSWMLLSDARGAKQRAYEVLVASSPEKLAAGSGDRWASGRVESDRCVNVAYGGAALASREKCWWKVRAWAAGEDQPGEWSEPATFEMGLLAREDWRGSWISAAAGVSAPLLRKRFTLPAAAVRGRVYVCGLGCCELHVNGRRVGDRVMDPAPTWYDNILPQSIASRVLYVTYDITDWLVAGDNAIGVLLGHGWYSSDDGKPSGRTPLGDRPVLLLQGEFTLADGRRVSVASDTSWKASASPITANEFCAGERYDARLEQDGWATADFDDAAWAAAAPVKAPGGRLAAMALEPCRITQRFRPVRVLQGAEGAYIFDMGQYISGWAELRVAGPAGTAVTLRHAGRVNYDTGTLDTRNNMSWHPAHQTDAYTLRGAGVETWHPRFTIHGFRYVEVTGWPGVPTPDDLTGCAVNNDVEAAGEFACSDELVNRVHHNVWWTFRGSLQGMPQDASDRAERLAWLGDPGFVAEDYMVNFRDVRFWSKWLDDIADAQTPQGQVPFVAPPFWDSRSYTYWPCWECSYALFAWFVYQYNDDLRVLEKHYEGLRRQVAWFGSMAVDGVTVKEPLGDHMEPRDDGSSSFCPLRTPAALAGTAYYFRTAQIVSDAARLLGKADEARDYARLAEEIRDSFNRHFLQADTGQYGSGSQTANALALYLGLVPPGREPQVLANLVADIEQRGNRLSTGIIGTDALEQALPRYGRADVMLRLARQTAFPSWGFGVVNGQTTIAECFEANHHYSLSMKMLGSVEKFLYKDVAGLAPAEPGWRRIEISPKVAEHLDWSRASYRTAYGLAAVEWRRNGAGGARPRLALTATVPANTTAVVRMPALGLKEFRVRESGRTVWPAPASPGAGPSLRVVGGGEEGVEFEVGSGEYRFELEEGL